MIEITKAEKDAIQKRIKDAYFARSKRHIYVFERADVMGMLEKRRRKNRI